MTAQRRKIVLGGPGVGKTHSLLARVEEALRAGVPPTRIAFVAFTRAAAEEAKSRAKTRFNLADKDLPYFRTLHSLCFRELGTSRSDILMMEGLEEFAEIVSEELTGHASPDSPPSLPGDRMLAVDELSRTMRIPLKEAWNRIGEDLEWYRTKRFSEAFRIYKTERGFLDFTDLLIKFAEEGWPIPVDLAIIDEGQDLTDLQWAVVEKAFSSAAELIIAGDDDQAIYAWSGASGGRFLALPYEREVLPVSHRLPAAVFEFAQSIVSRVTTRFEKHTRPGDRPGKVEWVANPEEVDFSQGSWLALARTRHQLTALGEMLREQGVTYTMHGESSVDMEHVRAIQAHEQFRKGWRIEGTEAALAVKASGLKRQVDTTQTYTAEELQYDVSQIWHDALVKIPTRQREYYLACRRRGEPLHEPPRIRISTIHGAKGAEAESVLLLTDLTYRAQRGFENDPDSEHRVFYVGATRAGRNLFLVPPKSVYGYAI